MNRPALLPTARSSAAATVRLCRVWRAGYRVAACAHWHVPDESLFLAFGMPDGRPAAAARCGSTTAGATASRWRKGARGP